MTVVAELREEEKKFEELLRLEGHILNEEQWPLAFIDIFEESGRSVVIIGRKGSGKTALGLRTGEIASERFDREVVVFDIEGTPFKSIHKVREIPRGAFVIVDEAELYFHSRRAMATENVDMGNLLSIARHKGITLIFISQAAAFIDINLLQLADYIWIKEPTFLLAPFERSSLAPLVADAEIFFAQLPEHERPSYFVSASDLYYKHLIKKYSHYQGVFGLKKFREIVRRYAVLKCRFSLPSFWTWELSTRFAGWGEELPPELDRLRIVLQSQTFTAKDVMNVLNLPRSSAYYRIKQWEEAGFVKRKKRGLWEVIG